MHVGRKRIFVGNLPPHVEEYEIRNQFEPYGTIVSVDIKHRKDGNEETSPVFAFVSIETDDNSLHTCFQEISNYDWQGYYVKLQLAKESFLERLKREREETQNGTSSTTAQTPKAESPIPIAPKKVYVSSDSEKKVKKKSKDKSSESSDFNKITLIQPQLNESDDDNKLVIKNNKHKVVLNGKLKIESVSATPIYIVGPKSAVVEPRDAKSLAAEEKRKKSLTQMKNSYNQQKTAIRNALSFVDLKPKNKISFDDQSKKRKNLENSHNIAKKNKIDLFENDADDEDYNFEVKQQFEGKKGQKLLELQSRYTNDKRFTLDSRFLDEDQDEIEPYQDEERDQQYDILESVLGKKLKKIPKDERDRYIPKPMLRFDPSNPKHTKFELIRPKKLIQESTQGKHQELELPIEPAVEVSKETFYKVTDNLKESLQQNNGFSLLNMFGKADEKDEEVDVQQSEALKPSKFDHSRNPFKYDSSDTEDDADDSRLKTKQVETKPYAVRNNWHEAFFFGEADKRLQNGFDFLRKLGEESKDSFPETRRELKQIIRAKVRNNQRNNRPFRKKLGKSKMIKVKKAKKG